MISTGNRKPLYDGAPVPTSPPRPTTQTIPVTRPPPKLTMPARQRFNAIAGVLDELQLLEQRIARGPGGDRAEAVGLGEQLEMLGDRELVPQQRKLRAVAKTRRAINRAAVAGQQSHDDLHQRALARPVLAHQPHQLTGIGMQARAA